MNLSNLNINKNNIVEGVLILVSWAIILFLFDHLMLVIKILWNKLNIKLFPRFPVVVSKISKLIFNISDFIFNPLARLIYLVLSILFFTLGVSQVYKLPLGLIVIIIGWSFYSDITRSKSKKQPIFTDTFQNLESWNTITGNPTINSNVGNPSPSLFLPIVDNTPNNSCLELNDLQFTNGIIEADIYLEPGSLVNIVFRADFSGGFNRSKYYMARFDSRQNSYDGFLRNDGNGWSFISSSNNTTAPNLWHRIRITVSGDTFQLYNENGLLVSAIDPNYKSGSVGIFNEVANVFVDNFSVRT